MTQTERGTLLKVRAGTQSAWALLKRTDATYDIPLYIVEVMHGKHKGAWIAARQYCDRVII